MSGITARLRNRWLAERRRRETFADGRGDRPSPYVAHRTSGIWRGAL